MADTAAARAPGGGVDACCRGSRGIRPALTALVLASLARMIFFGPPFASRTADMTPTMVSLTGFVIAGAAVSLLVAKVDQLAVEQAALRRVATQVAQSMPTGELFALTALEAGRLVGADYVRIGRYESDDLVGVATWDRTAERRRDSAVGVWSVPMVPGRLPRCRSWSASACGA